jgi:DNA-binding response OmpR family regulator
MTPTKERITDLVNHIYYLTGALETLDRRCTFLEMENARLWSRRGVAKVPHLFLKLSHLECEIVSFLLEFSAASRFELAMLLYEDASQAAQMRATTVMKNVRKKLAPYEIEIHTVFGSGYALSGGSKAILNALLEQHHTGASA